MSIAVLIAVTAAAVPAVVHGLTAWAAIPVLLASYAVAVSRDRRTSVFAVLAAAVAFALAATVVASGWWTGIGPMVPAAMLTGAAVGDAVRSRRELAVERAVQVRREERLRIAQDVHDMVAQHIAVVNVQAGVATHLLHDRPDAAAMALGHVTEASGKVLDQLGALLGVLREPVAGLADLESLTSGLRVERRTRGTPRALPATVDSTVYRVVQESLANARKYGTGWIRLTLDYQPGSFSVEIRNERSGAHSWGTGYGLLGMRERVAVVGGVLAAGPEGNEFVVRAGWEAV